MPIEGEVIILNRGQVEIQQGTVSSQGGEAWFEIAKDNPEVDIRAGREVFHIFSDPKFTNGQVTLFSPSLRTVSQSIGEGIQPFAVYNGRIIFEETIPPGEELEIEWLDFLRLTIRNK